MIFNREQLEAKFHDAECVVCDGPICVDEEHEVFVRVKCHPEAGLDVAYSQGVVTVSCGECGEEAFSVEVASENAIQFDTN